MRLEGQSADQLLAGYHDKVGFSTPERDWFLGIVPSLQSVLNDTAIVPFLDRIAILRKVDAILSGERAFSWQLWRWVNYIRWYTLQGFTSNSAVPLATSSERVSLGVGA